MAVELYLGRATKRYTHAVCCTAYMHVAWCPLRSLRSLCQFVHRTANCHAAVYRAALSRADSIRPACAGRAPWALRVMRRDADAVVLMASGAIYAPDGEAVAEEEWLFELRRSTANAQQRNSASCDCKRPWVETWACNLARRVATRPPCCSQSSSSQRLAFSCSGARFVDFTARGRPLARAGQAGGAVVRTHPSTDTPQLTPPRHDPSIGGALVRRTKQPTWHNASAAQPPATISSALPRSTSPRR